MNINRVFLIVLDSFGIGEMPDAQDYGDKGSNTLKAISKSVKFNLSNLKKLGLMNIDSIDFLEGVDKPLGCYGRLSEASKGKDTTIGHWEMAGLISNSPLPVYPNGFPESLLNDFSAKIGRGWLCNKPYSGTKVIEDFGEEHMKTGKLIIYTSADSVLQIAAHEDIVPIEKLYDYCKIAREMLNGEHSVGRVIARPFIGEPGTFKRTSNRHDFSLIPPGTTMLDVLSENGYDVIGIGKISDIFAGKGITESTGVNKDNTDGMEKAIQYIDKDFKGLCFINLVDFDMLYGHRNDVDGYAQAMSNFDVQLEKFIGKMRSDDVLIITADHGCDPSTASTDHSREYVPVLIYGENIKSGINLNTRNSFSEIAATIQDMFGLTVRTSGESFLDKIIK